MTRALSAARFELAFDRFQRYQRAAEIIEQLRTGTPLRIADVGGGEELLARFLPHDEICVVDRAPQPMEGFVQGAAESLPFRDGEFDVVVCVDMLEHLPAATRPAALAEMLRIGRGLYVLAAPFSSPAVHLAERLVYDFLLQAYGERHPSLEEHFACGLPDLHHTVAWLRDRSLDVVTLPNGELYHWVWMMCLNLALARQERAQELLPKFNAFYNEALYAHDHREPSYRQFVVAGLPGRVAVAALPERLRRPGAEPDPQALLRRLAQTEEALAAAKQQHARDLADTLARAGEQLQRNALQLGRLNDDLKEIRQSHYEELRQLQQDLTAWHDKYERALKASLAENERLQTEQQRKAAAQQETLFQQKRAADEEIARLTQELAAARQSYGQEIARLQTETTTVHEGYQKRIAGLEMELSAFRLPWFGRRKFSRLYQTYQQEVARLNRLLSDQQLQYSRQVQDAKADKERQVFFGQQEIDRLNGEVVRLHKNYQEEIDRLLRKLGEQEERYERRLRLAQSTAATNGHAAADHPTPRT